MAGFVTFALGGLISAHVMDGTSMDSSMGISPFVFVGFVLFATGGGVSSMARQRQSRELFGATLHASVHALPQKCAELNDKYRSTGLVFSIDTRQVPVVIQSHGHHRRDTRMRNTTDTFLVLTVPMAAQPPIVTAVPFGSPVDEVPVVVPAVPCS